MAIHLKYTFPAGNTQDVCLTQNTTGPVNLVLNGNLSDNAHTIVDFLTKGYSRQVSLSAPSNLSAVIFTIYGMQNGELITEEIAGPNANTVYSTEIYDVISAITTSATVANISIGTGPSGFFPLTSISSALGGVNYTLSLGSVTDTNIISTAVYSTLDDITLIDNTYKDIIANNVGTLATVKADSADELYVLPVPPETSVALCNSLLIALNGSAGTIANGIIMIFIQI